MAAETFLRWRWVLCLSIWSAISASVHWHSWLENDAEIYFSRIWQFSPSNLVKWKYSPSSTHTSHHSGCLYLCEACPVRQHKVEPINTRVHGWTMGTPHALSRQFKVLLHNIYNRRWEFTRVRPRANAADDEATYSFDFKALTYISHT